MNIATSIDDNDVLLVLTPSDAAIEDGSLLMADDELLGVTTHTAASLSTNLSNATNNDLVFTAKTKGNYGNDITVAYVDPGGATATLGVVVVGKAITVNLGRTGNAIDTTGDLLKAAIEGSPAAAALVTVADKAANDGSGLVAALAPTALSGGGLTITRAEEGTVAASHSGDAYVVDHVTNSDFGVEILYRDEEDNTGSQNKINYVHTVGIITQYKIGDVPDFPLINDGELACSFNPTSAAFVYKGKKADGTHLSGSSTLT